MPLLLGCGLFSIQCVYLVNKLLLVRQSLLEVLQDIVMEKLYASNIDFN